MDKSQAKEAVNDAVAGSCCILIGLVLIRKAILRVTVSDADSREAVTEAPDAEGIHLTAVEPIEGNAE
jgi:hypothetical protein